MAGSARRSNVSRLHEAAWPDMFANLQTAYADLTRTQFELQRRAAQIEDARDLFQLVIESMSEALFLLDRTGRVTQTNPAARRLLARDENELIGLPFSEACGTDEIPSTAWNLLERSAEGGLHDLEATVRTLAGRRIPVSVSCSLVRDKRGRLIGNLIVARDISERKQAEEALAKQARELERSNAELEQFAYVASHDLQEPLRMMGSFSQLLSQRYRGKLDDDADDFIEYIVDGASRMQRLIRDLLAYSRVGTRGKPLVPTDCSAVVSLACRNLRAALEESGAEVRADGLPTVLADEVQLVQLFQNLIGNALKFRGAEPTVVEITATPNGNFWQLNVRDNGIGFDPQYGDRIFVIFQRLHSREEYDGTGIGLSICKKIIERHGGQIWATSNRGEGSVFSFTLPALGMDDDRTSRT